ncbi:hypothetical protein LPB67_03815 [Undibacterium sp. Jales W-56]|uniref:hypothetical protein n=1 Tax=Undibacterium sp. Jales W-56 TaxID=2897325 RepID=UPI0021CF40FA|nr:hypothetical protein [Undibacterium sp. Jales W-56]MCU6432904.1 hypothetical protein [Undibacterium sp. Jales W-56]
MKTLSALVVATALAVGLSACGERNQSLANNKKDAEKPWHGAKNEFVAKGWTPGDQTSWNAQIRARGQNQNEYAKTN